MIRIASSICVALVGIFILYLPSAHQPAAFLQQLRNEHVANVAYWGPRHATRILARMVDLQSKAPTKLPVQAAAPVRPVDAVLAQKVADVGTKLVHNRYVQSIGTLLLLATFRFSGLVEWLPLVGFFIGAALFDGLITRLVKSKEFRHHSAETYGFYALLIVVVFCATIVTFVGPWTVHPSHLALALIASGVFARIAIANFHKQA